MSQHLRALLALAVLMPPPAQAALPCDVYDEQVAAAAMILQIGAIEVERPPLGDLRCTLRGTVLQSFRGPIAPGTRIETRLACAGYPEAADEEIPVEPGSTVYWDFDALRGAAVIELHIAAEGGPAGSGAGVVLLDAVTDAPAFRGSCTGPRVLHRIDRCPALHLCLKYPGGRPVRAGGQRPPAVSADRPPRPQAG